MNRPWSLALIGIIIGLAAAAAWWLWPRRENVILITIDTLRPDRISAYGYRKHETPNLDRLARDGTLFEHAFCDVTWTTPSMTSVMTGLYASRHGFRSSFQTLSPQATTLAEILQSQGYQTAAVIASYPLHSIFGLNQGFELYDETFNSPSLIVDPAKPTASPDPSQSAQVKAVIKFLLSKALDEAYRPDADVSERAIAWLRHERGHGPFFLWVHYFGPHEKPTGTDDLFEERKQQLAAYDPDVVTMDGAVGRVLDTLDELGLTTTTTVILNADHGQSLTEHDYFGHGRNVFDPTQHIPLIVRSPRHVPKGRRVTNLVRNLDLMPTILELVDIPVPPGLDGTSLLGRIAGTSPGDDAVYVETYMPATWLFADVLDSATDTRLGFRRIGIRTLKWKYVINDPIPLLDREVDLSKETHQQYYTDALYDLENDPGETVNVEAQHPELTEKFLKEIWLHQSKSSLAEPLVLDASTRERLKALGYVGE